MHTAVDVRAHDHDVPAPRVGGPEVRSIALAEATLAATNCVVLIDHTAIEDDRMARHTAAVLETRHAILRTSPNAEQVVRLRRRPQ